MSSPDDASPRRVAEPLSRRHFLAASALGAAVVGCQPGSSQNAPAAVPQPIPCPSPASSTSGAEATSNRAPSAEAGLSTADIAAAERVAGVTYTQAEREQVVAVIDRQLDAIRSRRAHSSALPLAPAQVFDPVLPGRAVEIPAAPVRSTRVPSRPLPASDADICFAPVTQLADWLRRRAITSVRLTELYLERMERLGPALSCAISVTRERALEQAARADREIARGQIRSPVHGIPYGAKDLFDTRGIATTFGAGPYRTRVPDSDATVIARLEDAGAVLMAKTTLGALAYGDIWFGGKTRNPWNRREGSSGSSAGSAAATVAGLVGFSLGTETLGSIVSPSMRCGATGLRPTFGRVPRTGAMPLVWSMDKIGPICRTVEDTALVLAAIHGADPGDPSSRTAPFPFDARAAKERWRVGYDPAWFADKEANDVDRGALEAARALGCQLVEVAIPQLPYEGLTAILLAEAAAAFEDLTLDGRDDQLVWQDRDAWPNSFRAARFISAVDLVQAGRLRRQAMLAMHAVFARVDVLMSPSFVGPLLRVTNYTGHPSLTLRAGFVQRDPIDWPKSGADLGPAFRAPHGITLYGRLFAEHTLCRLGMALERALGVWHERPPQ